MIDRGPDRPAPGDGVQVCHRARVVAVDPTNVETDGFAWYKVRHFEGGETWEPGFNILPEKAIAARQARERELRDERDRLQAVVDHFRFDLTRIAITTPDDNVERLRQIAADALDIEAALMGGDDEAAPNTTPKLLTAAEVAKIRRKTTGALTMERRRGQGPPYLQDGRRVLYNEAELHQWLADHLVEPGTDER